MKFQLIDAENDHHDVSLLARVLGVSRQGYYLAGSAARRHVPAVTSS